MLDNCEHVVTEVARLAEQLLASGAGAAHSAQRAAKASGSPGSGSGRFRRCRSTMRSSCSAERAAGFADVVVAESDSRHRPRCVPAARRPATRDRAGGCPHPPPARSARARWDRLDDRFLFAHRWLTGRPARALSTDIAGGRRLELRPALSTSLLSRRLFEIDSLCSPGRGRWTQLAALLAATSPPSCGCSKNSSGASSTSRSSGPYGRAWGRRFSRLLQTLAFYGRERLAERPEAEAVRLRHAEYFADFGDRGNDANYGDNQRAWLTEARDSTDDVRAAIDWSIEHGKTRTGGCASRAGSAGTGGPPAMPTRDTASSSAACRCPGEISTLVRARALVWLTYLGSVGSRALPFVRLTEEAMRRCREAGDERLRAFAAFHAGGDAAHARRDQRRSRVVR